MKQAYYCTNVKKSIPSKFLQQKGYLLGTVNVPSINSKQHLNRKQDLLSKSCLSFQMLFGVDGRQVHSAQ